MQTESILSQLTVVKNEQRGLRRNYNSKFLMELDEIIEKCFLSKKDKKEHFITQEKLIVKLLHLLATQKKFKNSEDLRVQTNNLCVFDTEAQILGKIININYSLKQIEFVTLCSIRDKKTVTKHWDDIELVDIYSPLLEFYHKKQIVLLYDYSYKEVFSFLSCPYKELGDLEKKKDVVKYSFEKNGIKVDKRMLSRDLPLEKELKIKPWSSGY